MNPARTDRTAHTIQPTGRLDQTSGTQLRQRVEALIQSGVPTVLVDCSQLGLIDSAGLRALVKCGKDLQAENGNLLLCDLQEQHQLLLELTGLDTVFTVL